MSNDNGPRVNDAALRNIVLPFVISIVGFGSLIDWFLTDGSYSPVFPTVAALGPLVWIWLHREDWANRHK